MAPRRNNQMDPAILAAVNQALTTLLPTLVAQTAEALRQNPRSGAGAGGSGAGAGGSGAGAGAQTGDIHVWLERFQKQKPNSFSSAATPIDAENWISHMEKVFDVLGCTDNHRVKLAAYKLEGDAQRWWKTIKQARGGDAFLETLTWNAFRDLFYQQYFSKADKDAYVREYSNIEQREDESITDFLARFVRLAGFIGAAAGTSEEQADKFKWAVLYRIRCQLVNLQFADVAAAANAARNIEMNQASRDRNKKRNRNGEQVEWNQSSKGGSKWGQNNSSDGSRQGKNVKQGQNSAKRCNACGRDHPGNTCYRAIRACFICGQVGHLAKDCKNTRKDGAKNNEDTNTGRVFALGTNEMDTTPGNFQDQEQMKIQKAVRVRYGRFFYRFPNGESAADVYDRITGFRETLRTDIDIGRFQPPGEQSPNMNLVIVSHGLTLRVFLMRWYKWTVEQFERLNNMQNGNMIVMQTGQGGRYSLLVHHTEQQMLDFGLTREMLDDQQWQKTAKPGELNYDWLTSGPSFFTHLDDDNNGRLG